ncbi:MAG: 2-amino-4-hydroxy-6-hydroxymethyldihydropteridine diphosphokinase [bacterium]
MAEVFLSVGSNLGNRKANCELALQRLNQKRHRVVKRSSFYRTRPLGLTDQPNFLNIVVELLTESSPWTLLSDLQRIEKEIGRRRSVRWGPRLIDLDIIFFDRKVIKEKRLTVPHPLIQERGFVLIPLLEIAPDIAHPVLNRPCSTLLAELNEPSDSVIKID